MAAHAETSTSAIDTAKLVVAIAIVVSGIVGFYYFASQALLYRVLGVMGMAGIAVALVATTSLGGSIWEFLREARTEVRRVVWPTRQETVQATLVVVALVFLVGLFLWLLDMLLAWGVGLILGQKV